MMKRIMGYLEYRKNRKIAKREFAKMAAVALPTIRKITEKNAQTVAFIHRLADSAKNIEGDQLVKLVLDEVADTLKTSNSRIIEVLTYMSNLSPEDMGRIFVHSVAETAKPDDKQ